MYDGKEQSRFKRNYQDSHNATIWPTEDWQRYERNVFDRILFLDINGLPLYCDPERSIYDLNRNRYGVSGPHQHESGDFKVIPLNGENSALKVSYLVEVSLSVAARSGTTSDLTSGTSS